MAPEQIFLMRTQEHYKFQNKINGNKYKNQF